MIFLYEDVYIYLVGLCNVNNLISLIHTKLHILILVDIINIQDLS